MAATFSCNTCHTTGSLTWMSNHPCGRIADLAETGGRCEDFPCCGHTDGDGCAPLESHTKEFWQDNPHRMCSHEDGFCDAEYDEPDVECEGVHDDCPFGGCGECDDDTSDDDLAEFEADAHLDANDDLVWCADE